VTKNGEDIAVKKLKEILFRNDPDQLRNDQEQFRNEFYSLRMLKHKNIVQVLGYCYETKQMPMELNGIKVLAEETHRALCLEYLHSGSLKKHLSGMPYVVPSSVCQERKLSSIFVFHQ